LFREQRNAGQCGEFGDKPLLKVRIGYLRSRNLRLAVIPIFAAYCGRAILTDRKPRLRQISHFEIVRRAAAAHFGRHPTRIDGVAQDVGPVPGDRESKRGNIKLAFGVGFSRIPAPLHPIDVECRPAKRCLRGACRC
jgi:hypothetical protein